MDIFETHFLISVSKASRMSSNTNAAGATPPTNQPPTTGQDTAAPKKSKLVFKKTSNFRPAPEKPKLVEAQPPPTSSWTPNTSSASTVAKPAAIGLKDIMSETEKKVARASKKYVPVKIEEKKREDKWKEAFKASNKRGGADKEEDEVVERDYEEDIGTYQVPKWNRNKEAKTERRWR